MKYLYKILYALAFMLFTGCGTIYFVSHEDSTVETERALAKKTGPNLKIDNTPTCEKCLIVPRSGSNRDLRYGYYYDLELGQCVHKSYSTGAGCIPPAFKTLEECQRCCGGR